ncbi:MULTISPECIES: nucleoid occlusion factor SlmA [unclassified Neptuniibacter]|uniref:nucleoid occlusion factor SlmA n=1 Tax=unclassified Neptuniibacter TaxID=2630693 RepID=UPI000C5E2401|nr:MULTISPECIES: nucleoid occlusion factor SlmA [unclassified Neptuniibacter]MAY42147.1 nucleoid occlusion factor SlmA [Oceanospirillaceae bacterium]|tara:strand:+ start:18994 stop:19587 length:594 start_codon:yes stop_codon:yes gene_type:complete
MSATEKLSRREQILQSLAHMLENPGQKITTAALAKEVGVSEAALYRHFPSKARMFEGLIGFIEETVFSRVTAITQVEADGIKQCEQVLTLVLAFVERNPGMARILTGEALAGETDRLRQRINQFFERLETQLKQIMREAEAKDGLRTQTTAGASANLLIATVEGRIRQFVRTEFRKKPSEQWQDQWPRLAAGIFRNA